MPPLLTDYIDPLSPRKGQPLGCLKFSNGKRDFWFENLFDV
jgi:hypothetical protein